MRLRRVKTESNSALFSLCLPEHVPEEINDGVHEFDQSAETGIFMDLTAVFAALSHLCAADVAALVAVVVFMGRRRDLDFLLPQRRSANRTIDADALTAGGRTGGGGQYRFHRFAGRVDPCRGHFIGIIQQHLSADGAGNGDPLLARRYAGGGCDQRPLGFPLNAGSY